MIGTKVIFTVKKEGKSCLNIKPRIFYVGETCKDLALELSVTALQRKLIEEDKGEEFFRYDLRPVMVPMEILMERGL